MTVGVYWIDSRTLDSMAGYAGARMLVRSVRDAMPGVSVVHFTDDISPEVEGADRVSRLPREPMAILRMRHHARASGDWLFLDADVLIQRDVRHVFDQDFDIAVADRNWSHVKSAVGFADRMPYNMGVVFSRSAQFWADVLDGLQCSPKDQKHWMGDQDLFCRLIRSQQYHVALLPGATYNFPPSLDPDDANSRVLEAAAAIVHFKGPKRKPLMLTRIGERVPCA